MQIGSGPTVGRNHPRACIGRGGRHWYRGGSKQEESGHLKLRRKQQVRFGANTLMTGQCAPWRTPDLRVVEHRAVFHDEFLVVESEDPAHQRVLAGADDPEGLDRLLSLGSIGGVTVLRPPDGLFPWWQTPQA